MAVDQGDILVAKHVLASFGLVVLVACGGNVFSLEVGTCFDEPSDDTEVSSVPIVECSEPHDREVYFLVDYPASDTDVFPGEGVVDDWTVDQCLGAFDSYVGEPYETSEIAAGFLTPSPESWDDGDRESVCYAFELDETKITGSVQGINR